MSILVRLCEVDTRMGRVKLCAADKVGRIWYQGWCVRSIK